MWPSRMTWKEKAKALLLRDCEVDPDSLAPCLERLRAFATRYQPYFKRSEQRELSLVYLRGLLSPLDRKSVEPIAYTTGERPGRLQHFVGVGKWNDDPIRREMRVHVVEELGHPDGVLIVDPSQFPKKGTHSVGVRRQWCGNRGKTENCQSGVFFSYDSPKGHTLVASELHLSEEWTDDPERRRECRIPDDVLFRTSWQIADDWLLHHAHEFPHRWILGDEEFGKSGDFRSSLHARGEQYLFQIQAARTIRLVKKRQPKGRPPRGGRRRPLPPFEKVGEWAKALPPSAWTRLKVRDGEKGWVELYALRRRVQTRSRGRINPHVETLLVTRTPGPKPEYRYWLSNDAEASVGDLVSASARRHWIEKDFERGKGEVGLSDYEVRSWVGWHHHMTLALLALFFLVLERRRLG